MYDGARERNGECVSIVCVCVFACEHAFACILEVWILLR